MALGFIAGRWLGVNLHSIARLLMYIIAPLVFLGAMIRLDFQPAYILLPVIAMALSYLITFGVYQCARLFWHDGMANLIGGASVNGNAIYFGLPVILALFGPAGVAVYLFMNLGPAINNFTLGYYLVARGKFSVRDSWIKLAKFPVIYAVVTGIGLNLSGVALGVVAEKYWNYASGSMVMLGMMMIGVGLSKIRAVEFNIFQMLAFLGMRFLIWPLGALSLVMLDRHVFGLFGSQIHQMALIFSVMPIFGNLVAYASEHKLYPERAAAAVLISTLFTLIAIPVMLATIERLGI